MTDGLQPVPLLSTFQLAARAGRSNLVMTPLVMLAGFGATVAVARVLPPSTFALYAAVLAFRGLMGYLGDLGAGTASNRLFAQLAERRSGRQARRAFWWLTAIRLPFVLALVLVIALFPGGIADAVGLGHNERFLLWLVAVIGAAEALGSLGYYALSGTFNHRTINRVTLAAGLIQPAAIIAAAVGGAALDGIVAGVALGSVVKSAGFCSAAVLALRRIPDTGEEVSEIRRVYARVAGSSFVGKLAGVVHQRQALTFVGLSAFSRTEVAAFALAYDFALQVLATLSAPVYSLLVPGLTAVKDDRERTERVFSLITRLLAQVVGPIAVLVAVTFPTLVAVLFGEGHHRAIAFGLIFLPTFGLEVILSGPATALLLADENLAHAYRRVKAWTLAAAVLYIPVATWSLLATAGLMMAIRVGSAVAMHWTVRSSTGITAGGRWTVAWVGTLLAGGAAALVASAVTPATIPGLVIALLAGTMATAVAARITGMVEDEDLAVLDRAVPGASRIFGWLVGRQPRSIGEYLR